MSRTGPASGAATRRSISSCDPTRSPSSSTGSGWRRPRRRSGRSGATTTVGRTVVGVADHLAETRARAVGQGTVARGSAIAAWLPIIYGCDKTCTYCIVPFSRGPERSRPFDDILDEARSLAAAGYREVTLLGQNVNSYGHDLAPEARFAHVDAERWAGRQLDLAGRPDLAELIRAIDALRTADGQAAIGRLRFVTSHPWDLSDRLIAALADCGSVCEHLHLPVQSGSDAVLRRMGRQYTIEHYTERLTRIREAVPGIAVSTDIIVGFCGETEAQFEETLALLETVRYDQVFAAAYSPRPGTPATHLEDDVPAADKRRRLNTLLAVQEAIGLERNEAWLGREVEVLVDAVHAPREHEHERPRAGGRGQPPLRPDAWQQAGPPRRRRGARRARGPRPDRARRPVRAARRARRSVTVEGSAAAPRRRRRRRRRPARPSSRSGSPRRSARTAVPWRSSRPTRARSSAASTSARPRWTPRTGRASRTSGSTWPTPTQPFSVADFAAHARGVLADLARDGGVAILAGGTGLYLRAVGRGLDTDALPSDPALRARLEADLVADGLLASVTRLEELAPALAAGVDTRNPRRVVRALEIAELRGDGPPPPPRGYPGPIAWLGLAVHPHAHAARIATRARAQFDAGLIEEARALRERFDPGLPAFSAIGYREAWAVLDGELTRDAAIELDAQRNLAFSKRQRTWFRSEPDITWLDATEGLPTETALELVRPLL